MDQNYIFIQKGKKTHINEKVCVEIGEVLRNYICVWMKKDQGVLVEIDVVVENGHSMTV